MVDHGLFIHDIGRPRYFHNSTSQLGYMNNLGKNHASNYRERITEPTTKKHVVSGATNTQRKVKEPINLPTRGVFSRINDSSEFLSQVIL